MPWVCPQPGCHFENADDAVGCGACGYRRLPRRVQLVGASGRALDLGITTPVGRDLLADVAAGEQRFAAAVQFRVIKGEAGWLVEHAAAAKNPTYYQGAPLPAEPVPLEDGGVLSVGPDSCKLTVRFVY